MVQESTPPIQVGLRRLVFRDSSVVNIPGIDKNKFQITF